MANVTSNRMLTILMADDDPDDRLLAQTAFDEISVTGYLHCVEDGEELLDYLHHRGRYANSVTAPRPDLILLDLNMPRKGGNEVIFEIKSDPELRRIPIVVLTTSRAEEDVIRSYDLGVSSFIVKPLTFTEFVDVMEAIGKYWAHTVELPNDRSGT